MENLIVCLDVSESMGYGSPHKLCQAIEVALKAVEGLETEARVGLVVFNSEPEVVLSPSPINLEELKKFMEELKPRGVSRIAAGLHDAMKLAGSGGAVLLLTDGRANLSLDRSTGFEGCLMLEEELVRLASSARKIRVTVHGVAVGEDSFTQTVKAVAEAGGGFFWLAEEFQSLTFKPTRRSSRMEAQELTVYPIPAEFPSAQPTWTKESQLTHVAVVSRSLYEAYRKNRLALLRNALKNREARIALIPIDDRMLDMYRRRRPQVSRLVEAGEAILLDKTYRDFLILRPKARVNLIIY